MQSLVNRRTFYFIMPIFLGITAIILPAYATSNSCSSLFSHAYIIRDSLDIEVIYKPREITITDLKNTGYIIAEGQTKAVPYRVIAKISFDGILSVDLFLKTHPESLAPRSVISGQDAFDTIMAYFGPSVRIIEGYWSKGDNYQSYIEGLQKGLKPQAAVLQTWTGRQVAKYGFTDIIVNTEQNPNIIRTYFRKSLK